MSLDRRGALTSPHKSDDYDLEKGSQPLTEDEFRMLTVIDCELQVRFAFIRKVYTILSVQLLVTFGFVLFGTFSEPVKLFLRANVALLYVFLVLSFVFIIILVCVPRVQHSYPSNLVVLGCFTFCESYLLACIASVYTTSSVCQAIAITLAITVGLTIFTVQSKIDFSMMGGFLFVVLMVFVFGGFMRLFLPSTPLLDTVWAGLGALLFSAYIVYDTFMLMNRLGPEDYIMAAISLYLDIINLFIYILELIGKKD